MEKKSLRGPRPGLARRPMSTSRKAVLEMLRDQPEPTTLAALVKLSGLHQNTVREHLDALVGQGFVRRERALPHGRGRPAWLYETTGPAGEAGNEYAALASVLATTLAETADDPAQAGIDAGTSWGRRLISDRGLNSGASADPRGDVITLLAELGFAPEVDRDAPTEADLDVAHEVELDAAPEADGPREVRLTRCPLLEAAHRQQEVVCGVHLGIVRGAYAELGVDADGTELVPFAEPGACRLTLPAVTEHAEP